MLTAIFGPQLLKFIIDWGTTGLMFGISCSQLTMRQRICGQSLWQHSALVKAPFAGDQKGRSVGSRPRC